MPIYEYQCPKCGKFDVIQKMSARPLKTHDVCGSKVTKLVSAGTFAFKGTGFYSTDYKANGKGKANGQSDKGEKKSESPACDKPKSEACGSCPSAGKAA